MKKWSPYALWSSRASIWAQGWPLTSLHLPRAFEGRKYGQIQLRCTGDHLKEATTYKKDSRRIASQAACKYMYSWRVDGVDRVEAPSSALPTRSEPSRSQRCSRGRARRLKALWDSERRGMVWSMRLAHAIARDAKQGVNFMKRM